WTLPNAFFQYRVVTPLLPLPFVLLLVALLVPRERPRRAWEVVAGCALLGLVVHLYFFFWTAVVAALGVYLLAVGGRAVLSADPSARAQAWFVGLVLVGGLVIGAPQILSNGSTFADARYEPVLDRLARGQHLAPGDPARALYLKNAWAIAKIALGG